MTIIEHLKRFWIKSKRGDFTVNLRGNPLSGPANEGLIRVIYTHGVKTNEVCMGDFMVSMAKDKIVVDIGAHIGYYTVQFAKVAHTVYAFEPSKIQYSYLHKNTLNLSNVVVHNYGISDKISMEKFLYADKYLGSSHVASKDPDFVERDSIIYDKSTIVSVLPLTIKCDIVKIDVEGFELNVLKGIKYLPKYIFIEMSDITLYRQNISIKDLVEFFVNRGYKGCVLGNYYKRKILRSRKHVIVGWEFYKGTEEPLVFWTNDQFYLKKFNVK